MMFVDTNVIMYAVGRPHPLQEESRRFFREHLESVGEHLCTSAEVLQELLHAYLPVERFITLDAALRLVDSCIHEVHPIEAGDVLLARALMSKHPSLGARDLLHLACCRRRGVTSVKTFDRALAACFRLI